MTLVAVTSVSFSNNASLVGILKEIFPDVRINDQGRRLKDKELAYFLQNAQAAIIGTEVLNEDVLAQLPDLRVIAKYGVGLDNVNFNLLKQHDVHLRSTGGVNRRSVSELALTGIIGLARNVFFSGIKLKNGEWCKHGGFELTGKTVGIVGCGNIGEDLLRLLQPFKCNLLINDILDKSDVALEYGARQVEIDELIEKSDFVSLHVPLTDSTRKFISYDQLQAMKKNAYLVNTARGPVIDQSALKQALANGEIAGAFLDVFEEEPPVDSEFLSMPNLMVSPHIGGNSAEAIYAMGTAAIENLLKGMKDVGLTPASGSEKTKL